MSNYKNYQLSQLGIRESSIKPSEVERDAFPGIDPDELETGIEDEKDEHEMSIDKAKKTAIQHLETPDQKHYYSGLEKAKSQGMLKDIFSPTAIATPVIALGIRGSSTGGLPSGQDQTGVSQSTESGKLGGYETMGKSSGKGKLGGYEEVSLAKNNSELVNKTPSNPQIKSNEPIAVVAPTIATPHAHQIQQGEGNPPQSITGADSDDNSSLTLKSALPKGIDIDVNEEDSNNKENSQEPNDMDGEESMEDEDKGKAGLNEGKHKAGCKCGFCANKGSFGKKKKETDETIDSAGDRDDTGDYVDGSKQKGKKGKKLLVDKEKADAEKVEEGIRYSPAFEKMRGLANIGKRKLSSSGLWENVSVPANVPHPLTEKKNQDPTKEEMVAFLYEQFGNEEGFEFDSEEAIFWFAEQWHGGQSSNLYSALSTSQYRPGRMARGPEDELSKMMYQTLESEYGGAKEVDTDIDEINHTLDDKGKSVIAVGAPGSIMRFIAENPDLIKQMREWVLDCQWNEDPDDIEEMDDNEIFNGIQKHYEGGVAQFIKDSNSNASAPIKSSAPTTERLNEIKSSLYKKAISGKMNVKETKAFHMIQEILSKRSSK